MVAMMATYKGVEIDLTPTATMAEEAQRGLDWREEHGRGGTRVGVARANQIVNRQELSPETVRRMVSFFARHEVDKEAEGFRPGEDGYPSAGRIAWALWAGDPGRAWANEKDRIMDSIDEEETRALEDEFSDATLKSLRNKVDEHNEKYGDKKGKRVTLRMLAAVYKRGIGAYQTNPGSVRPTVTSAEQWAMARVNVFLRAVRTGKFPSGKFDTDLLPDGHPMKTEEEREIDLSPTSSRLQSRVIKKWKKAAITKRCRSVPIMMKKKSALTALILFIGRWIWTTRPLMRKAARFMSVFLLKSQSSVSLVWK
jgi:hypothetical protein